MKEDRRVVFGSFTHSDEAISAIEKLKADGYAKEEITVYSSEDSQRSFDVTDEESHRNVEDGDFDTVSENSEARSEEGSFDKVDKEPEDDDDSLWESVKDFFTPDSYDYEKESENSNYRKENDVLYPHRQDIADGNRVVVLDRPLEDENRIQI